MWYYCALWCFGFPQRAKAIFCGEKANLWGKSPPHPADNQVASSRKGRPNPQSDFSPTLWGSQYRGAWQTWGAESAALRGAHRRARAACGPAARAPRSGETPPGFPGKGNRGFYRELQRPLHTRGEALKRVSQQPAVLITHEGRAMSREKGFINHGRGLRYDREK